METKALTVNEARQIAIASNFSLAYVNIVSGIADKLLAIALTDGMNLDKNTLRRLADISHLNLKAKKILKMQLDTYNKSIGQFNEDQPKLAEELQKEIASNELLNLVEKEYNRTNQDQLLELFAEMGIQANGS